LHSPSCTRYFLKQSVEDQLKPVALPFQYLCSTSRTAEPGRTDSNLDTAPPKCFESASGTLLGHRAAWRHILSQHTPCDFQALVTTQHRLKIGSNTPH
jgi:hypothetical protein